MGYALFFLLAAATLSILVSVQSIVPGWIFVWPIVTLVALSFAYLRNDSRAFGKQSSGGLSPVRVALFGPWLFFAVVVESLARVIDRTPPFARVDDVFYGRRTRFSPVPKGATIVDLTAEFAEPQPLRGSGYLAFPILDARAPNTVEEVKALIAETGTAPVFIHCAQGRGRTGLVAACFLLARGVAESPDAAIEMLRKSRPGIRLNREQGAFLQTFAETMQPAK